jgi:putative nucleotidyltransferase with HDIG domain
MRLRRAADHPSFSHRCDELPAVDGGFLAAPLRHGRVFGALQVAGHGGDDFGPEDQETLMSLARAGAVALENALAHEAAHNFFVHVSDLLVSVLDSMDVHYPQHSRYVAAYSDMVSRRLGMSNEQRRSIHYAALLHDIGKIKLDPKLLRHVGAISDEQRLELQEHPTLGVEVLRPITMWEDVLPIVHAHHERWDGKGYPRGLAGEDIPIGARVVAVAEVFDAISRPTPHTPKRSVDEALAELERCAGTQFDPLMVKLFVSEYREHGDQIRF